jgi:hypothetical protein
MKAASRRKGKGAGAEADGRLDVVLNDKAEMRNSTFFRETQK